MSRFINPFTDWGFKFIFGREVEKAILIDFLNDLLSGEHVITDLTFMNMETLERMPFKARKAVFDRLEQIASVGNLTAEQRDRYEEEWKMYNDYYNTLDFAEQKGMQKGIEKGRKEGIEEGRKESLYQTALSMKKEGIPMAIIIKCTGLSQEEIESLS